VLAAGAITKDLADKIKGIEGLTLSVPSKSPNRLKVQVEHE